MQAAGVPPPSLADGDIRLRVSDVADAALVTEALNDWDTTQWLLSVPHPYPHSDSVAWIRNHIPEGWRTGTELWLAVADQRTNEFLGEVGLKNVDRRSQLAEIAYWLRPAARGGGIGGRALRLLITWAFDELQLHRIDWAAAAGNDASRAVAERLGFVIEGTRRQRLTHVATGVRHDEWVGGLTRSDWEHHPVRPRL